MLGVCTALLVAALTLASHTRFDNSFEAYFDTRDPTYAAYNQYRADFASDEVSYILYEAPETEHGAFDLDVMRRIAGLTATLEEEVPFVSDVTSLTNVEYLEGVPGGLKIHDLLEGFPETQQELLAIREKALAKPLYVNSLVSPDGRVGAIVLEMERSSVDPVEELRFDPEGGDGLANLYPQVPYQTIEAILARPEYDGIVFHHVGDVAFNAVYNTIIEEESGKLGLYSMAAIALLLFVFFRGPLGVIGPLAVVVLSVVVAVGFIGTMGWTLDLFFIMLPTLLIAVGVADAVHIIVEFRAHHAELGDRREAARQTLYLVGTPCLLTSLTTAAGFASLSIAPIESIAHFAIYSAVGVLAAFVLSVTLLLVFLSLGRRRLPREATKAAKVRAKGGRMFQAALLGIARFDVIWRRGILAVFAALFAFSAAGIARLEVDSNFMTEFSKEEPIRIATEYVDRTMGGTQSMIYLFDSGEPEGVKNPAFQRDVERIQQVADAEDYVVRKSVSIGDLLKDLNKSFHDENDAYYQLPESRELIGQYLLLYELSGGEEISDYLSGDFSRAALELRMRSEPTSVMERMVSRVSEHLEAAPPEASVVTATGIGALWLQLQEYIVRSQVRGFLLAFTVITVLMCLVFRSVKTGLIAMVPNLAPVVFTLGTMGWLGIPLDYIRLFIGSVAIGIAVDDTIHLVIRFRREFLRSGSYETALRHSMTEVGRALVITSVVLVSGFLVFCVSRLDTYVIFGGLLASTVVTALVADFLLAPALILTLKPWGPERS